MSAILTAILSVVFFPITLLSSWVILHPFEEVVVLRWGELVGVLREPGIYFVNVWGRRLHRVSTARQTLELPRSTVADGNGNPIIVSGVITFAFADVKKAALEVQHAGEFVRSQALAVLKQIASRYPYEAKEGHSLKSEAGLIGPELARTLEKKVEAAGAHVVSFELSDLAYAPEIAPAMLIRQQAMALVDARKTIVEGAVEIVREAVELLEAKGLGVPEAVKPRLVSNLLTVICGEAKVQPVVSVAANDEGAGHESNPALERIAGRLERIAKALPAQS
jgi:regulator of protease activity HflC (stomatin/prohibitin superfamily)